jgi:hypothetical protein
MSGRVVHLAGGDPASTIGPLLDVELRCRPFAGHGDVILPIVSSPVGEEAA